MEYRLIEELRINLNSEIHVKLTDLGKEIYYHRYDDLNERAGREVIRPSFPKVDADGNTRFLLWDFINLYGDYICMGAPNVIDPLEIVCKEEQKYGIQDPKNAAGCN